MALKRFVEAERSGNGVGECKFDLVIFTLYKQRVTKNKTGSGQWSLLYRKWVVAIIRFRVCVERVGGDGGVEEGREE